MDFDIIFIGAGLNYAGAIVAARAGLKCMLIEKDLDHLGGACLHEGCIPSKHLLHYAATLLELRKPAFQFNGLKVDIPAIQQEKNSLIIKTTKVIRNQLDRAKVNLMEGTGKITSAHTVEAAGEKLLARHIVMGTGSLPFIPEGIKFDADNIITSNEALNLESLPENIAIMGAGPIALEFASFFIANGVDTSVFVRRNEILPQAHPVIRENLTGKLEDSGVKFHFSTQISSAEAVNGKVSLQTSAGPYTFDKFMVATGRKPNTECVAWNDIETGRGIVTDSSFETTAPGHYAIGDCNNRLKLAHAARAQALFVVDQILGRKPAPLDMYNVPRFINTLPLSYARVGMVQTDLEKHHIPFNESVFKLSGITISRTYDATEGVIILYSDKENYLTGAEVLSPQAPDIIGIITTALNTKCNSDTFRKVIFPHPTLSEAVGRCAMHL